MCGIAGAWNPRGARDTTALLRAVARMSSSLYHRGPDADGLWSAAPDAPVLAHRRLSILDLSEAGAQPRLSPAGRYIVVFNGEIYNHRLLRAELRKARPGLEWQGNSDTETLAAGFEIWGIENTLKKSVGMFALAIWDALNRTLTLARDRMGEKPLYYGMAGKHFLFGSELKSFSAFGDFHPEIENRALVEYLRFNHIDAPRTIYKGIFKLPPGHLLVVAGENPESALPKPYWSLKAVAEEARKNPILSHAEALEQVETAFSEAVRMQLLSDVPLGAFLSGGIDSSLVTALMQSHSAAPVKTFTIGFDDRSYDESAYARKVAAHLGTDHVEEIITSEDALSVIPLLPSIFDEPFADSSQIPTYLVSRLAARHVKVTLSGDGGDELFAGYNRHLFASRMGPFMDRIPSGARRMASGILGLVSPDFIDGVFGVSAPFLPERFRLRMPGVKLHKMRESLSARGEIDLYEKLIGHWDPRESVALGPRGAASPETGIDLGPSGLNRVERMQYWDMMGYLPGDILAKVDRSGMAVGLESRIPFLDHRLVELSWRIPTAFKIKDGKGKWLLRRMLHRRVPAPLFERPKMGFALPLSKWLCGPLRDWAEDCLDPARLSQFEVLDTKAIRKRWEDLKAGRGKWEQHLWIILMLQAWRDSTLSRKVKLAA